MTAPGAEGASHSESPLPGEASPHAEWLRSAEYRRARRLAGWVIAAAVGFVLASTGWLAWLRVLHGVAGFALVPDVFVTYGPQLLIVAVVGVMAIFASIYHTWLAEEGFREAWQYARHRERMLGPSQGLDLVELWRQNQEQLADHHRISTEQAQHSHRRGQIAVGVGMATLIVVLLAVLVRGDLTTSIAAGVVAAIGAALAGYVSKTYLGVYEQAARRLEIYRTEPVAFRRFLAAWRIADDLPVGEVRDRARIRIIKALLRHKAERSVEQIEGDTDQST